MPTRNTEVLKEIIEALDAPSDALAKLEQHFESKLLIIAGDTQLVAQHAETLRLVITAPECAQVLDYIGHHALAGVSIDVVEEAINTLFEDRFLEP